MVRMATYDKRRRYSKLGRGRATRPKTFLTEEAAKAHAEANGMKNYELVNISTKNTKQKIKIVEN